MTQFHRVVIRLHTAPLAVADWLAFDAAGQLLQQGQGTQWPAAEQLDLALPAAWLTQHRLRLPASKDKQRQQLIAQALEDRVLGPLTDYRWQSQRQGDDTCVWVWPAAEQQRLSEWLASQSWAPQRWIAEFALLPAQDDVLLPAGEGWLLRCAGQCLWLADASEAELLCPTGAPAPQSRAALVAPSKDAAVLLRGKISGVSLRVDWQQWRWPLYLLGVLLVLLLLGQIIQWRQLASREASLRQELRQTFASLYPGVPVVDPVLQWQSLQQNPASQGQADALALAQKIASQLDGNLGVESLAAKEGKVSLILPASQAAAIPARLQAQGLKVTSQTLPDGRSQLEITP
ncbi:type II secretion system protein GspL [Chitinibacter tainanensis]|uniref:type II secretion system protein GspL n=1 Tax=Chitinibacter tainanensis TaxID=230667 RepID=UPI0023526B6D|nr:type II secretion system protein GspL [Chitinibacter tainanensis]